MPYSALRHPTHAMRLGEPLFIHMFPHEWRRVDRRETRGYLVHKPADTVMYARVFTLIEELK
jgi:hypothetical protein